MNRSTRRSFVVTSVAFGVLGLSRAVRAAPPGKLRAQLDPPAVQVEEEAELNVEIEVADSRTEISRPKISGAKELALQSMGSSMSTSIVYDNGRPRMSQTRVFSYLVSARKAGSYTLAIEAEVGDATLTLDQPLVLKVSSDPAAGAAASPKLGQDDTVVVTKATPKDVFVGQQVTYVFEAWESGEGALNPEKMPSFKDCWVEALPRPDVRGQRAGGIAYRVHTPMLQAVFPQVAGELVIAAPVLRLQPAGLGMLFGGRRAGRARLIAGEEQKLQVRPLPTAGQPPGFAANNVGTYTIKARVDRENVVQGDAITVSVEVSGEGNIRFAELEGWPTLVGVRRYEPKADDPEIDTSGPLVRGTKRWSQLVIAQSAGVLEIPAHAITYFDPHTQRYARATSEVLRVVVGAKAGFVEPTPEPGKATPGTAAAPESEAAAKRSEVSDLAMVASDLPIDRVPLEPVERSSGPGFWLAWTGIPLGFCGLGASIALAQRFWRNPERLRKEALAARESQLLQRLAPSVPDAEFFAAVSILVQERALACAGPTAQGVQRARLLELVRAAKVPAEVAAMMGNLLDRCDAARFGAGVLDVADRERVRTQLVTLLAATQAWTGGKST